MPRKKSGRKKSGGKRKRSGRKKSGGKRKRSSRNIIWNFGGRQTSKGNAISKKI